MLNCFQDSIVYRNAYDICDKIKSSSGGIYSLDIERTVTMMRVFHKHNIKKNGHLYYLLYIVAVYGEDFWQQDNDGKIAELIKSDLSEDNKIERLKHRLQEVLQ